MRMQKHNANIESKINWNSSHWYPDSRGQTLPHLSFQVIGLTMLLHLGIGTRKRRRRTLPESRRGACFVPRPRHGLEAQPRLRRRDPGVQPLPQAGTARGRRLTARRGAVAVCRGHGTRGEPRRLIHRDHAPSWRRG